MKPKEMILKCYADSTEFIFTIKKEEDKLHFIIKENDDKCPFIFESTFDLDNFIQINKAFKSCDDISEVEEHFYILYEKNKLYIILPGLERERYLGAKIGDISKEDDSIFPLEKKYTYTNENVMELYGIYKKDKNLEKEIKNLKEKIKNLIRNNNAAENPLTKELLYLIGEK